jgi:hypothetical protein
MFTSKGINFINVETLYYLKSNIILLLIEKLFLGKYLDKTKVIKYIYTSLIIIISFLIFSTENTKDILKKKAVAKRLFPLQNNTSPSLKRKIFSHLKKNYLLFY